MGIRALLGAGLCWLAPLVVLASGPGSTDRWLERGDSLFGRWAYARALEVYLKAADGGARNLHVCRQVGRCYVRLGRYREAEPWYAEVTKYLERTEEDVLVYAALLLAHEDLSAYEAWMEEVLEHAPEADRAAFRARLHEMRRTRSLSSHFEVLPVEVNGPANEFAPAWVGNGRVLFSTDGELTGPIRRLDAWTGGGFTDILLADRNTSGDLTLVGPVKGGVNTPLHEAGVHCTANGLDLFYSGSREGSGEQVDLAIHQAAYQGGERWRPTGPVFGTEWPHPSFHPTLSKDGTLLIFATRVDEQHGTDLYQSELGEDGWSVPVPVGGSVNSTGNELFPHLAANGDLYFTSDGHPGFGGLDLFVAQALPGGGHARPHNLGSPMNTPFDELSMIVDPTGRHGYFASDRPGGKGGDDLYRFELTGPLMQVPFEVAGRLVDAQGRVLAHEAEVWTETPEGRRVTTVSSDARGRYAVPIDPHATVHLMARVEGKQVLAQRVGAGDVGDERTVVRDLTVLTDGTPWLHGHVSWPDGRSAEGVQVTLVRPDDLYQRQVTTAPGGQFLLPVRAGELYELYVSAPDAFTEVVELPVVPQGGLAGPGLSTPILLYPATPGMPVELADMGGSRPDPAVVRRFAARLLTSDASVLLEARVSGASLEEAAAALEDLKARLVALGVDASRLDTRVTEASSGTEATSATRLYYVVSGAP